jgi:branched-chain amino acid transport system substrate-binding protein
VMISSVDPRTLPEASEVVRKFRERGYEPEGYTIYAYAAVQVWARAVEEAGTDNPTKVAEYLRLKGPLDTVIGKIAFDEHGNVKNPKYAAYAWHNGSYAETNELR